MWNWHTRHTCDSSNFKCAGDGSADDEETVRVQHRGSDGEWSEDDNPTEQNGYARLQVAVSGNRAEVRRARLFALPASHRCASGLRRKASPPVSPASRIASRGE